MAAAAVAAIVQMVALLGVALVVGKEMPHQGPRLGAQELTQHFMVIPALLVAHQVARREVVVAAQMLRGRPEVALLAALAVLEDHQASPGPLLLTLAVAVAEVAQTQELVALLVARVAQVVAVMGAAVQVRMVQAEL